MQCRASANQSYYNIAGKLLFRKLTTMESKIIEKKSVRYQKTLLKLPLQTAVTATGNYPIPEVDLIPSIRNNSVVPQHEEEDDDVIHLVLTPSHSLPLPCDSRSEGRKVSVMSLLSFIANGSNRPSIFSQFRWIATFIIPSTFQYDFLKGKYAHIATLSSILDSKAS